LTQSAFDPAFAVRRAEAHGALDAVDPAKGGKADQGPPPLAIEHAAAPAKIGRCYWRAPLGRPDDL
jgi:hypothetical protein